MDTIDRIMENTDKEFISYYQRQFGAIERAHEIERARLITELVDAEGPEEIEVLVRKLELLAQPIRLM